MPRVPSPIPIFPSYDNFPAEIESFPPNVHVRARLEQLDLSLRPFEACEYAWRFIQSKLLAGEILYAFRYSLYTRCIETLLNWCFLIRKKSVFYLTHEDVREFIRFFVSPEPAWVGVSPSKRLIVARSTPYTDWKINPGWRIFVRNKDEPPVKRTVHEMCVTMKEFLALMLKGEGEDFAPLQRAISEASKPTNDLILFANKEIYATKESYVLSAAEIEWLLDMVRCRCLGFSGQEHLYNKYQRIIFVLAVACYTQIPLGSISRQLNKAGLLIQFELLSSGSWVFHESLGSNSQGEINLEPGFIPYLERYLYHLGIKDFDDLPAKPILPDPKTGQGYTSDTISEWLKELRVDAVKSALQSHDVGIRERSYAFSRLNYALLRRSRPYR